eukprot:SM000187S03875  [mRNA]  locus=s187:174892:177521:+ [translate_table: standard]
MDARSRTRAQVAKVAAAAIVTAVCMFLLRRSSSLDRTPPMFRVREDGIQHVLVTGGAGFVGSHAVLRLLEDGNRVTIIDNLSRGNMGAIDVLQSLAVPGMLQFIIADLGDPAIVDHILKVNAIDVVIHFAAVAYVGESMAEPLRYYHNITANTLTLLQTMARHGVNRLIYSSTCATYGEPPTMPITEDSPQVPINPYGKAKKFAEDVIRDYARTNKDFSVTILRYFNVIGSDPKGRLGEAPRPELRHHGRISGACFDAAAGKIDGLKVSRQVTCQVSAAVLLVARATASTTSDHVEGRAQIMGTNYNTHDGTCIRDYIHVTDLVDAHVVAMKAQIVAANAPPSYSPGQAAIGGRVAIYNVGTGKGKSVREFVNACLNVTGKDIKVVEQHERRPGDYAEVFSDPSKILKELQWQARYTDLQESLRMAWDWQKEHPNGYGSAVFASSN